MPNGFLSLFFEVSIPLPLVNPKQTALVTSRTAHSCQLARQEVAVLDCGYGGVINPARHILIHLLTAAPLHSIINR
jgi:hypothetical protein